MVVATTSRLDVSVVTTITITVVAVIREIAIESCGVGARTSKATVGFDDIEEGLRPKERLAKKKRGLYSIIKKAKRMG